MPAHHTVTDFVNHIKRYGVASPNRFDVTVNLPKPLQDLILSSTSNQFTDSESSFPEDQNGLNARALSLMAQAVSIPGYSASVVESQMNALTRKIPYAKSYGEFDITFVCSADMREKKIFDAWQKYIFKPNHTQEYYDNIISEIEVAVNTKSTADSSFANATAYKVKFLEAYPTVVTQIQLDRSQQSATMTFQVTFAFWKMERMDDDVQNDTSKLGDFVDAQYATQGIWIPQNNITAADLGAVRTIKPFDISIFGAIDAYKSIKRAIDELKKGVDPRRALQIVQNITQQIETTAGLDATQAEALLTYLNDVAFSIQGFKGLLK